MAKPCKLVVTNDGKWKVKASFPTGRYYFSLRKDVVSTLVDELQYRENDIIPWQLFRLFVYTGDAWLPNQFTTPVETGKALSRPNRHIELSKKDAKKVAEHLVRSRLEDETIEAVEAELQQTILGQYLAPEDLRGQVQSLSVSELNSSTEGTAPAHQKVTSTATAQEVRVLQLGATTLGRRNLGRSERVQDFLEAFRQAIDIAVDFDVTAVVQAGKLFQSRSPSRTTVDSCRMQLQRLRDVGIPFYTVFGSHDRQGQTHIDQLIADNLLIPLDGQIISLGESVRLVGFPHGAEARVSEENDTEHPPGEGEHLICAFGGVNLSKREPSAETLTAISETLPKTPDVILTGGASNPIRTTWHDVPIVDSGPTENILGKSTFDAEPTNPQVYEYRFDGKSFAFRCHDLQVRPYEVLRYNLSARSTLEEISTPIEGIDLSGTAVVCLLEGQMHTAGLKKDDVQEFLSERCYCTRVYDERTEVEEDELLVGRTDVDLSAGTTAIQNLSTSFSRLDTLDTNAIEGTPEENLVDLYVLSSVLISRLNEIRTATRDSLTKQVGVGDTVQGTIGSIRAYKREFQKLKDEAEIFDVMEREGIPRNTVLSEQLDKNKLSELIEDGNSRIHHNEIFEQSVSKYVQRNSFDELALKEG